MPRWCSVLKVLLVVTNLPAGLYLGLVHQRGPLDVTAVLAARLAEGPADSASVLYLMPCHSTPLYRWDGRFWAKRGESPSAQNASF